ncbi:MAG: hypothetical protein KBA81_04665 [Rhabdochlamydiaceae bacterium]|nr:hypothetical protein [Rhabdochlamydiaceae bacterium]
MSGITGLGKIATQAVSVARTLKQKISDLRSAPKESQQEVEIVPHQTFETFLADKANKGFSFKDKLKYRGIESLNARGIKNNIKAFFSLGAIGYFVRGKVNESNKAALTEEAQFYRTCCNVQEVFGKFKQKPDANFTGLKQAYELVLSSVAKDADTHNEVNLILDKLCKASVGGDLLDFEAMSALQSRDGFTMASVLNTITGQAFLADINAKHQAGYRGRAVKGDEKTVLERMNRDVIQQNEINTILNNEGTRSIFQSYAHAYNSLRDQVVDGQHPGITMSMDLVDALSLDVVNEDLVQSAIDQQNKLILELVQKPAKQVTAAAIPVGCEDVDEFVAELDRMTEHYASYHENLDAQANIHSQLAIANLAVTKAEAALDKESAKTRTCTFAEMEKIYGPILNERLPGVSAYRPVKLEKDRLADALEAKNDEITTEINTLEGLVGNEGSLIREQEALQIRLASLADVISKHQKEADGYKKGVSILFDGMMQGSEQNVDVLEKIKESAAAIPAAVVARSEAAQKLATVKADIARERANLRLLQTNSKIHPLIAEKISLEQNLAACLRTSFALKHSEIKTIHDGGFTANHPSDFEAIAGQVGQLNGKAIACAGELGCLQGAQERNVRELGESRAQLTRFGFQFNREGQVTGFNHFNDGYQETMCEHLKQQGPLTANIIRALQLTASSIKDINQASIMNPAVNASVEVVRAAPAQVIPARRNAVNLVQQPDLSDLDYESDYEDLEFNMKTQKRPRMFDLGDGFSEIDLGY